MNNESNKVYETPVAERSEILQVLEQSTEPLSIRSLIDYFEYEDESRREGLRRRLIAMSRDGQIARNRRGGYGLIERMDLVRGR
ncbi:MAG TPA: ribonuclease R, partial [Gammaproteobacteria bacterium]|nr:ribonuclease R [Gammaproteobacteria bacterium]